MRFEFEKTIRERQQLLCGERYVGVSLGQIRAPEWAQHQIEKFINNPRGFLVYFGSPGIGKTFLCSALLDWGIRKFRSVRYWNESELLKKVRASMDNSHGDYLEYLKYLIDDDLVMIDDLGSCGLNEWRKEIIFDLIDERYCSPSKPTVITSNFTKEEIKKNFHERVYSRLFDKENVLIEIPEGMDLRLN